MEITLTVRDGKPTATSLQIAESFEKRHDDVIRAIRNLIADLRVTDGGPEFNVRNFADIIYTDSRGRTQSAYALTRDGFTLLAMGFTGEKALQFKMAYIDAFNRMEAELTQENSAALALTDGLPDIFRPKLHPEFIGSTIFRLAARTVHMVDCMSRLIANGKGYMLPEGIAKITIPGKWFLGWYTDTTLRIPLANAQALQFMPYTVSKHRAFSRDKENITLHLDEF